MKKKLLVPSAPILVESTRSIGYSFDTAIADIIDNSIGKGAKEIHINFSSIEKPYVAIIDDACGMSEAELEVAMKYGSKSSLAERDKNDLGRFGLGLKMASLSQCRKLTVVTKKDNAICGAKWDLDYIIENDKWLLQKFTEQELTSLPHFNMLVNQASGTIVIWEDFDRISDSAANFIKTFDEKISMAQDHVALVFHRFTGDENFGKRLKIFFNGNKVEPVDPFLSDNPATQPLIEQTLKINGGEIKVKPYILPYPSKMSQKDKRKIGGIENLRHTQGFFIYRNKRLIIWGTWFRLIGQHELNKLARVRVDIPNTLDAIWEIDIKKSTASLPDIIKKNLVQIVDSTVGRSERVYNYRGRRVDRDGLQHIWNPVNNRGKFQYLVNRELPIFKLVEEKLDEAGLGYLDTFVKMIEDAFPYQHIYCEMAKNEGNIQEINHNDDEVYRMAVETIEGLRNLGGDIDTFLAGIEKTDFFCKYPRVIAQVKEEYKDELKPEHSSRSRADAG